MCYAENLGFCCRCCSLDPCLVNTMQSLPHAKMTSFRLVKNTSSSGLALSIKYTLAHEHESSNLLIFQFTPCELHQVTQ